MAAGTRRTRPTRQADVPRYEELPTDISSLANILEAAMTTAASAPADVETPIVERQESPPPAVTPQRRKTDESGPASLPPEGGSHAIVQAAVLPDAPSAREAIAFDEVARSLGAAEACVPLLAQSTGLLRIAALDVVKAETARAGGLLQLLRFLRGDLTPAMTAVSTSAVLQRLMQAVESERRLRGIALTSRSSVADATCSGDETLLVNTLLSLLLMTFAAIEGVANARAAFSVVVNDSGEIGLAVSQDHVAAPAVWSARAGSEELNADSGPALPAVALGAAHRLARLWGGRFRLAGGEHSSILTIWLPTVQHQDVEQLPH